MKNNRNYTRLQFLIYGLFIPNIMLFIYLGIFKYIDSMDDMSYIKYLFDHTILSNAILSIVLIIYVIAVVDATIKRINNIDNNYNKPITYLFSILLFPLYPLLAPEKETKTDKKV